MIESNINRIFSYGKGGAIKRKLIFHNLQDIRWAKEKLYNEKQIIQRLLDSGLTIEQIVKLSELVTYEQKDIGDDSKHTKLVKKTRKKNRTSSKQKYRHLRK